MIPFGPRYSFFKTKGKNSKKEHRTTPNYFFKGTFFLK